MNALALIAEGNPELGRMYRRFLTAHGYETALAVDGLDCVQQLGELHPDVLILDLDLNWGGGDGVLAWLREEACAPSVPVVLLATAGAPQLFAELGEPPVVACLAKPFTLAALLRCVHSALEQHSTGSPFKGPHRIPSEAFVG